MGLQHTVKKHRWKIDAVKLFFSLFIISFNACVSIWILNMDQRVKLHLINIWFHFHSFRRDATTDWIYIYHQLKERYGCVILSAGDIFSVVWNLIFFFSYSAVIDSTKSNRNWLRSVRQPRKKQLETKMERKKKRIRNWQPKWQKIRENLIELRKKREAIGTCIGRPYAHNNWNYSKYWNEKLLLLLFCWAGEERAKKKYMLIKYAIREHDVLLLNYASKWMSSNAVWFGIQNVQ